MRITFMLLILLLCSASLVPAQSKKEEEKLEQAKRFYRARESEFAIAALDELIEKYPKKTDYRIARAFWLADFAMFDESAEDLRDLLGMKLKPEWEFPVLHTYSDVLLCQGKNEEAIEVLMDYISDTITRIHPYSILAYNLYLCERYEEALTWFMKAREIDTHHSHTVYFIGMTLMKLRRGNEANAYFEETIEIENRKGESMLKPFAYILTGDVDKGVAELEKNIRRGDFYNAACAASVYCFAGREKDSMEAFENFWEARDISFYAYMKLSHDFDCLRQNEKFKAFYKEIFPGE